MSIPGQPPNPADLPPGCRFAPRCSEARPRCVEQLPALESPLPGRRVACFYPLLPIAQPIDRLVAPVKESP